MTNKNYDRIIIGAGLYGLYAALLCAKKGDRVLVLEYDDEPFARATYINQARVHMGYHYPRSLSTAEKSAGYFRRFNEDYGFSILSTFDQVYATSAEFSWTSASQFKTFCKAAGIRCDELSPDTYFNPGMCDGAFLTQEYTYDAHVLRDHFMKELSLYPKVEIKFGSRLEEIRKVTDKDETSKVWQVTAGLGKNADTICAEAPFVLNATYASTNEILQRVDDDSRKGGNFEPFKIKYELCEIILCNVSDSLKNVGLTVMDGPFFSIMPFGLTGQHSLTSVTFTPHVTSYDTLPKFTCQEGAECTALQLGNCNKCPNKPASAWPYMSHLAEKYMKSEFSFEYDRSLYSMKPILKSSEVDDSRPTAIRFNSEDPAFLSVLSGKINTVYDLDEYLM